MFETKGGWLFPFSGQIGDLSPFLKSDQEKENAFFARPDSHPRGSGGEAGLPQGGLVAPKEPKVLDSGGGTRGPGPGERGRSPPNPARSPDPRFYSRLQGQLPSEDATPSAISAGRLHPHVCKMGAWQSPHHPTQFTQRVNPAPQRQPVPRRCLDSLNELDLRVALITVPKELPPPPPGQVSELLCGVEC